LNICNKDVCYGLEEFECDFEFCTFVFFYDDSDDGICIRMDDNTRSCEIFKREGQCNIGGGIVDLSEKCVWVFSELEGDSGECKIKRNVECENLMRPSQCDDGAYEDGVGISCFWLEANEVDDSGCVFEVYYINNK
jgi:hypothetical protein